MQWSARRVAPYRPESRDRRSRRQWPPAGAFLAAALITAYLPSGAQAGIGFVLRRTLLRPFIVLQEGVAAARLRATRVEIMRGQLDSLVALVSTQAALAEDNRQLRDLLGLSQRLGSTFRAATAVRPGTNGSESVFLLDVGTRDGVAVGAPVVNRHGLVGVVREVHAASAVAMDWSHPDFRASAMLADGSGYGIVENRRGASSEENRLLLNGAAYHERVPEGTRVLTSGLGGVFPRGIPIGVVLGLAEAQAQWRKSYWLRPMVELGSITHVLVAVAVGTAPDVEDDLSAAWPVQADSGRAPSAAGVDPR